MIASMIAHVITNILSYNSRNNPKKIGFTAMVKACSAARRSFLCKNLSLLSNLATRVRVPVVLGAYTGRQLAMNLYTIFLSKK